MIKSKITDSLASTPIPNIPIILLAAGSSSRMGQPKQLLPINNEPLLRRVIKSAIQSSVGEVIVILGSSENEIAKIIDDLPVRCVSNSNWTAGMGSSIKMGIQYVETSFPASPAVIISVCDQPYLAAQHFTNLAEQYQIASKPIVASYYAHSFGVPVLFDRSLFDSLMRIDDVDGAKRIIQKNPELVDSVNFPLGEVDLDTMEDYNTFNQ